MLRVIALWGEDGGSLENAWNMMEDSTIPR